MPTSRITLRGGACHGRTIELEHPRAIPEPYLEVDGWPYLRISVTGPAAAVAVPRTVQPGPCLWCQPEGRGPAACSCVEDCGQKRCGQIGPRAE